MRSSQMAVTPLKALLFFAAGCTAVAAAVYQLDVVDHFAPQPATPISSPDPAPAAGPKSVSLPGRETAFLNPHSSTLVTTPETQPPSFDLVRVERDGSIVVAGKASPNARVEVVNGALVIGYTIGGPDGDFVIVADGPLKPGAYQLKLRSTMPEGAVTTSHKVAVVVIPETEGGQVLVLIEQPGKPSELVTVPEAASSKPPAVAGKVNAAISPASFGPPTVARVGNLEVMIEAVEIDGRKIFLAGVANPHRRVRAYINDVLLGDTVASPAGRFLIEAERDVSAGNHIIRVEVLGPDDVEVIAGATVPFERELGEAVAAVAPTVLNATVPAPVPQDTTMQKGRAAMSGKLAPKLQSVENAVIIRRGDTLWRISHRVYGRGVRYSTIYLANRAQISDPNLIRPGQVFNVPETTPEGEPANMKAVGEQAATTYTQ
jgi:nucleoid-associated protein YgaU